jgi:hypothetical protein
VKPTVILESGLGVEPTTWGALVARAIERVVHRS